MKTAIFIPARLASERLPQKALRKINGKSLVARVYLAAKGVEGVQDVFVAGDSEEVGKEIEGLGGQFIMTNSELPTGTDRIAQALEKCRQDYDVIVNLQGDIAYIEPKDIKKTIDLLVQYKDADIATIACEITEDKYKEDPNYVKPVISFKDGKSGYALYFTRATAPYTRDINQPQKDKIHEHVGIYAYRQEAFKKFCKLGQSALEVRESLEQLRALENDMKIAIEVIENKPISVDTAEDLKLAEEFIEAIEG